MNSRTLSALAVAAGVFFTGILPASELSAPVADRYEQMVVRSPQPGTAFDKVVAWYSGEGGGLEVLEARWRKAAADSPADGGRYGILLGMLAERRRDPAQARELYTRALTAPGDPAAAARMLAVLETTEGRFQEAAAAYRKALDSKGLPPPVRMDLLRSLALLHQRAFDQEKASAVWMEALVTFPDDPYILEEAGEAFLSAGDHAKAKDCFEKLAALSAKDPFRKVSATLRLARAAELAGDTAAAVAIYERAIEDTSPGSWINRDVRSRIEELFRRKDDLPGLLAYYERRTTAVPADYESLAAMADVLDDLRRSPEALDKLRAAAALAPSSADLKIRLIEKLKLTGRHDEAIAAARELATAATPESLSLLGDLLWDQQKTRPESRSEALETFHRIAPPDSTDPGLIAQLAGIFSAKGENELAANQYIRLTEIAPPAADARQKLAAMAVEKNEAEAAKTWLEGITAGNLATPDNFLTRARAEARLGFADTARLTRASARKLFPDNPDVLSFAWRQAMEEKDPALAEELFPTVWAVAPNEFFAEDTVKRHAAFLESAGLAKDRLSELTASARDSKPSPASAALLLQLALNEANKETAGLAMTAITDPPVRRARAAVRFAQAFGTPAEQVAAFRAVADADPRFATESLKSAAGLLAADGRLEEAIASVNELIARSPADGSLYTLAAGMATRAGKLEDAVSRLQEGIRYAGDPAPLRLQLATTLQAQGRLDEASRALTDAFEAESSEPRRADIFRRQVELALLAGTIDDLVAKLKERQLKEEGGARYGQYLAEIFLEQGDLLAAKEELEKSLGNNPESPASVSKLLDLAERGGDEEEALRLARRLVEIDPTPANRSGLIVRLFNAREPGQAMEVFQASRAEILADPPAWSDALLALRGAGFTPDFNALISDIGADPSACPALLMEIATLYLANFDYERATDVLWNIVESPDLAGAIEAVSAPPAQTPTPFSSMMGLGASQLRLHALQQIAMKSREKLQAAMPGNPGFIRRPLSGFRIPGMPVSQATPDQIARVQALFAIHQIANARELGDAFSKRAWRAIESAGLDRDDQFLLALSMADDKRADDLIEQQAADPSANPDDDLVFLFNPHGKNENTSPAMEVIRERVNRDNPQVGFQSAISRLIRNWRGPGTGDPAQLAGAIRSLLTHPGATSAPALKLQLVHPAMSCDDPSLTREILDSVKASLNDSSLSPQESTALQAQLLQTEGFLLGRDIQNGEPGSEEIFQSLLADPKRLSPMSYFFTGSGMRRHMPPSQLLNPSPELASGDSAFPIAVFRQFFPASPASKEFENVTAWFAKRAQPDKLDPYSVGMAYCEWLADKKPAALARIEKIRSANPTPRSAALLAEMHEKLGAPAKALEFLDSAEFLPDETPEVRALRRLRLLRLANQTDQAKELASKLARSRTSPQVRSILQGEISQLGLPENQFPNFAPIRTNRRTRDRSEIFTDQLRKLVSDDKKPEAARMVLQSLVGPLPAPNDYNTRNIRSNAFQVAKDLDVLKQYTASLEARLENDPADFDAAIRLMEIEMRQSRNPSPDRLIAMIESHPAQSARLDQALQILNEGDSDNNAAARLFAAMIKKDVRLAHAPGNTLEQLANIGSNPKNAVLLGEAIAGLADAAFIELYTPMRLARQDFSSPVLGQLAEQCLRNGNKPAAVTLLKRALDFTNPDPASRLQLTLRLAELQLESGDTEGARSAMLALFEPSAFPNFDFWGGGRSTLGNTLLNLLQNPSGGTGAEALFDRIKKLADATGTMPNLLASLENDPAMRFGSMNLLTLKTLLGETGQAAEWRLALKEKPKAGTFFHARLVAPIITVLAKEKDAKTLIPALLEAIPPQSYQYGGDTGLVMLAGTLPALAPFRKSPAVNQHIQMVLEGIMRDPNASQYLAHQDGYWDALEALLADARYSEVRRLLEFTANSRNMRHSGLANRTAAIQARLDLAEGRPVPVAVDYGVRADGTIRWKLSVAAPAGDDSQNQRQATWDPGTFEIPKNLRPTKIEFFAGPNPACLAPAGTTTKPGLTGEMATKPADPIGLVQARWTLPDGSTGSGQLVAYVAGENLITHRGIPDSNGQPPPHFVSDLPGPLGKNSASGFSGLVPQQKLVLDLASIELGKEPAIYAVTGWLRGSKRHGQLPTIRLTFTKENGGASNEGTYSNNPSPGQWTQALRFWSRDVEFPGANSLSKDIRSLSARLEVQANSGHNNMWQIDSEWDGLGLFRIEPPASTASPSRLLAVARKDASEGRPDAACTAYLETLRQFPREVLNLSAVDFVNTFSTAGRLGELYKVLSNPALYLGNPLRNGEVTFSNNSLLELLITDALKPGAPSEASDWLRTVRSAPIDERARFLVESAIFREESLADPSKPTPQAVLDLLGFRADGISRERVQSLFSNSTLIKTLDLLEKPESRREARRQLAAMTIEPEFHSARLSIEAALAAPDDPATALKTWLAGVALRRGNNAVNFSQESDAAILARIGASHPNPGDVLGAVSVWAGQITSDSNYQTRQKMEVVQTILAAEPPDSSAYVEALADMVLPALRQPQLYFRTDLLPDLANRLLRNGQTRRLEELNKFVRTHRSLRSDNLQREFDRIMLTLSMQRGELDAARPFVWAAPASSDGMTTLFYQWGPANPSSNQESPDSQKTVAGQPLTPSIPAQTQVEIHFGETPWEMSRVATFTGNASSGNLSVDLPSPNGFLKAVATVGEKSISGPLSAVLSGRRISPAGNQSFAEMLGTGTRPPGSRHVWKFASWVFSLDDAARNAATRGQVSAAIALAGSEPRTAIEICGDKLFAKARELGCTPDLIPLLRAALSTDDPPNPFFPKPGMVRIVNLLTEIVRNQTLPAESRAEALAALTDNLARIPASRIVPVWNAALDYAEATNNAAAITARLASDLTPRLSQPASSNSFARDGFNSVTHSNDIPTLPLVSLIGRLGDPAATRAAIAFVSAKEFSESNPARAGLIVLALEAAQPASQPDATWRPRIDAALAKASKNHSAASIQHAASFLAGILANKNAPPDLIFALQSKTIDYLIEKNPANRHDEVLLALLAITRNPSPPGDPAAFAAMLERANSYLASLTNKPSGNTHRIASKLATALEAAGHTDAAQSLKTLGKTPQKKPSN